MEPMCWRDNARSERDRIFPRFRLAQIFTGQPGKFLGSLICPHCFKELNHIGFFCRQCQGIGGIAVGCPCIYIGSLFNEPFDRDPIPIIRGMMEGCPSKNIGPIKRNSQFEQYIQQYC